MTLGDEGTEPAALEPAEANQPAAEAEPANPIEEPVEGEDDGTEEIDWEDGKKYRVPKPVLAGILKNKDYTTKTQAVAARQKALDQREQAIEADTSARKEHIKELAQLQYMDDVLAQYDNLDWDAYEQQDPLAASASWRKRELAKDARAKLSAKIDADVKSSTDKAQQATAKRLQETFEDASKTIPGWTPNMARALGSYAMQQYGLSVEELESFTNPKTYRMMHDLWVSKTASGKQPNQPQPKPDTDPVVPLAPVARGSAPANSGPRESQKIGDWMRARNKEVAAAGRR